MSSDTQESAATGAPAPDVWAGRVEVLFAGLIAALFFASFLALPVAGIVLPLAAVPIVRVTHRRGLAAGLASVGLAAILLFAIGWSAGCAAPAAASAFFASVLTALPAVCAAAVRRGADPSRAYLALCAGGFGLACIFLLAPAGPTDAGIGREIDVVFDAWVRGGASQPGATTLDMEKVAQIQAALRDFCKRYWVGLLGVSWVLAAAISFYLGARAGRPAPSAEATRFESLRVPAPIVALFVAAGAAWALAPPGVSRVSGNLLWPLAALYFLTGLSIICHFARRWFRAWILRVGLYSLVVYAPITVGVTLVGLFDW